MKTFKLVFAHTSARRDFATAEDALVAVETVFPGHYGYVCEDGSVMCWRSEADSVDDDGSRAVAQIFICRDGDWVEKI
jgi:hypothetical protein